VPDGRGRLACHTRRRPVQAGLFRFRRDGLRPRICRYSGSRGSLTGMILIAEVSNSFPTQRRQSPLRYRSCRPQPPLSFGATCASMCRWPQLLQRNRRWVSGRHPCPRRRWPAVPRCAIGGRSGSAATGGQSRAPGSGPPCGGQLDRGQILEEGQKEPRDKLMLQLIP
jgi:hypothetical protein